MDFNSLDFIPDWIVDKIINKIPEQYRDILNEGFVFTGNEGRSNYKSFKKNNTIIYDDGELLFVVNDENNPSDIYYNFIYIGDEKHNGFHCYYNPIIVNDLIDQHDNYVDDHFDDLLLGMFNSNNIN